MYSYQLIRSITLLFLLWCLNTENLPAMVSPTPELAQAAKMVSQKASKELQAKYEQAKQDVQVTNEELKKAQKEQDLPRILKATKAAQEAQVKLDIIEKQVKAKSSSK